MRNWCFHVARWGFRIPLVLMILVIGSCATKQAAASRTVVITSDPSGADAYVDKFYQGTTPVRIEGVTPGTHLIEVRKIGYLRDSVEVTIEAGGEEEIVIDRFLEEDPGS